MTDESDPDGRPISALRAFAMLVIFAIAVVLAVWLVRQLQESARMQDCLASGRTNCAPLQVPAGR